MNLSYIVVTYQSEPHLPALWTSLDRSLRPEDEVIFVDNVSSDGTRAKLAALAGDSRVKLVLNSANRGFGPAVNQAASRAAGEILVLVNPDCRWTDANVATWIAGLEAGSRGWGAAGPLIRYENGEIQPSQGGFSSATTYMIQFLRLGALLRALGSARLAAFFFGFLPSALLPGAVRGFLRNFENPQPVASTPDWLSGAFLVVSKADFSDIGGFDEDLFLYCEDEDLCRRLRGLGREIVFDPRFEVTHAVEGSRGRSPYSPAQAHRYRSTLHYVRKWRGPVAANALRFFYLAFLPLKSIAALFSGGPAAMFAQFRYCVEIVHAHDRSRGHNQA